MSLGERIYTQRVAHNMSQGDLADALDVSRQAISKWENNMSTPELEKIAAMSDLFGVTTDYLIKGTEPVKETVEATPVVNEASRQSEETYRLGIMLIGVGAACTVLVLLFDMGLLTFITAYMVLAGILCLVCKRSLGLWLSGTAFLFANIFTRFSMSIYLHHIISVPRLVERILTGQASGVEILRGIIVIALWVWLVSLVVLAIRSFRKMNEKTC